MNPTILLPDYPRTQHLPCKPNAIKSDLVASDRDAQVIFESPYTYIEEKVDGSHCAMCYYDEHPIIRNRSNILKKGHLKRTPAKMQFSSVFNWFYENKDKFEKLNSVMGSPISVYGEWMFALHGIRYDLLPTYFIAYDLYDWKKHYFLDSGFSRRVLSDAGFETPQLVHQGIVLSWEFLEKLCHEPSPYSSTDRREGLYVKVSDGEKVVSRFKMVREDFVQGCNWDDKKVNRNGLRKL